MLGQILNYVGGRKASKAQERQSDAAIALQKQMYEDSIGRNQPGVDIYSPAIQKFLGVLGSAQYNKNMPNYGDIYNSDAVTSQTNMDANQVANTLSATGALGTTEGNTNLAGLRGMNADRVYQNKINQAQFEAGERQAELVNLLNLVNIGQSATGQSNTLGANYANNQAPNFMAKGQAKAGRAMLPAQIYNQTQQQAMDLASMFGG